MRQGRSCTNCFNTKVMWTCLRKLTISIHISTRTSSSLSDSGSGSCLDSAEGSGRSNRTEPHRTAPTYSWSRPVDTPGSLRPAEAAGLTGPPPDHLVPMVMVPREAVSNLKHVHLAFLRAEVTCARTFQMQNSITLKMSRFLLIFLKFHRRHTSERIS